MRDLDIYKEDWIGLKQLDERGDLHFRNCPGNHMNLTWEWFETHVITEYLQATPRNPPVPSI